MFATFRTRMRIRISGNRCCVWTLSHTASDRGLLVARALEQAKLKQTTAAAAAAAKALFCLLPLPSTLLARSNEPTTTALQKPHRHVSSCKPPYSIYIQYCRAYIYLKVLAVDVLQAVVSEEPQNDLEHALGVRLESSVGVSAETLDKVGHHVVQALRVSGRIKGKRVR